MNEQDKAKITGVLLAGGGGRRMGGADKGLLLLRGRPLAAYALDALQEAAGAVLVNANRNREEYAGFGHPVIADGPEGFAGPLAGLLSAMRAAETDYVLTVPCDAPFATGAALTRLCETLKKENAEICAAHDGARLHPVFLLAERRLADDLADYLAGGGRKAETWLRRHRLAVADCSDCPECFANLNTPEDLIRSAALGG
jgi:molybdopterin-guanine dinucleotide biosynthesis protein A